MKIDWNRAATLDDIVAITIAMLAAAMIFAVAAFPYILKIKEHRDMCRDFSISMHWDCKEK